MTEPVPVFDPADIPFLPPAPANDDACARTCANWFNGFCKTCGASHSGYRVDGWYRCPAWRARTV